jgi:hypothetical protein
MTTEIDDRSWTVANCEGERSRANWLGQLYALLLVKSNSVHQVPIEDMVDQLEEQLVQE